MALLQTGQYESVGGGSMGTKEIVVPFIGLGTFTGISLFSNDVIMETFPRGIDSMYLKGFSGEAPSQTWVLAIAGNNIFAYC